MFASPSVGVGGGGGTHNRGTIPTHRGSGLLNDIAPFPSPSRAIPALPPSNPHSPAPRKPVVTSLGGEGFGAQLMGGEGRREAQEEKAGEGESATFFRSGGAPSIPWPSLLLAGPLHTKTEPPTIWGPQDTFLHPHLPSNLSKVTWRKAPSPSLCSSCPFRIDLLIKGGHL